jgi:hypothetical protein
MGMVRGRGCLMRRETVAPRSHSVCFEFRCVPTISTLSAIMNVPAWQRSTKRKQSAPLSEDFAKDGSAWPVRSLKSKPMWSFTFV